jgi:hypothetical protein
MIYLQNPVTPTVLHYFCLQLMFGIMKVHYNFPYFVGTFSLVASQYALPLQPLFLSNGAMHPIVFYI